MNQILFQEITDRIREIYDTGSFIPLHEPRFLGNEKKYLAECIDSTFVSSVGKHVELFEKMVAGFTGSPYAIASVNGTEALHMALLLAGVLPGDEVLTQPLTFIATANAIRYTGADPVFLDVDCVTMGMSPGALETFLDEHGELRDNGFTYNKSTGRRIGACIPMHTFGHPVKIDQIVEICDKYQIPVIEDAAESIGSIYRGKHTGTFGKMAVLSFNGNKIITTGGGGMILTGDEQLAKQAKHLTTQAKVPHPWDFYHDQTGFNHRLPNINAALGVAQMEQLEGFIQRKRELAQYYQTVFSPMDIRFFSEPEYAVSNYWLNAIILENKSQRDDFLEYSNTHGIMTRPTWTLMHRLPMFRDCFHGELVNAEFFEEHLVNIPSSVPVK
jgi:aminotransferase in exopolysaccharide biosynthesis